MQNPADGSTEITKLQLTQSRKRRRGGRSLPLACEGYGSAVMVIFKN